MIELVDFRCVVVLGSVAVVIALRNAAVLCSSDILGSAITLGVAIVLGSVAVVLGSVAEVLGSAVSFPAAPSCSAPLP